VLFYTLTLYFSGVFDAFVSQFGMGLVITIAIAAIVLWRRRRSCAPVTFR
jgi:hypothetical protein